MAFSCGDTNASADTPVKSNVQNILQNDLRNYQDKKDKELTTKNFIVVSSRIP